MCTKLIPAWQEKDDQGNASGVPVFNQPLKAWQFKKMHLPCRKCVACLAQRSLARSVQLFCELQTTEGESYFLTFTYNDDHLPIDYSVDNKLIPKLLKKISRQQKKSGYPHILRYEQNSEYGTQTSRPHYHAAVYNLNITDIQPYKDMGSYILYESPSLTKKWGKGNVIIAILNKPSCIYVAQHTDKKLGISTPNHELEVMHPITGEIITERQPEQCTRSPSIGKRWFELFGTTDLYVDDGFRHSDTNMISKIPALFDKYYEQIDPEGFAKTKANRVAKAITPTRKQQAYQDKFNREKQKQKRKRSF